LSSAIGTNPFAVDVGYCLLSIASSFLMAVCPSLSGALLETIRLKFGSVVLACMDCLVARLAYH
jgi:uncharacterized membrane protein